MKNLAKTFLLVLLCLHSNSYADTSKETKSSAEKPLYLQSEEIDYQDFKMHFAYSEPKNSRESKEGRLATRGIIFIHGTPGEWAAFAEYLTHPELQERFLMVSVDRLGWGKSQIPLKDSQGDFNQQSEAILAVMAHFDVESWTVVGHSLGASIAPKIALKSPSAKVERLLLLAGSLSPNLGKPRWYNRIANNLLIGKIIGNDLRRSNREIMALRKQLQIMEEQIKQSSLNTEIVLVQGMQDNLVSPHNAAYVRDHWSSHFQDVTIIELAEEGHFLPWRQTPLIIDLLLDRSHKAQVLQNRSAN